MHNEEEDSLQPNEWPQTHLRNCHSSLTFSPNNAGSSLCRGKDEHLCSQGDGMRELRWVALGFSAMLVLFSLAIMIVERTITAEAWALLLLAPVPAGFALTAKNDSDTASEEVIEWPEESDFDREKSVGDPADAGFDVPVL